ncbi:B3 domain-containing transcription factor VRN1 [Morella rubra]|uniref:B3 domain-containing transcription factor VRN1 n=1 Tax=Morella rubra TaxID=262757 RepID=A0A6A1V0R6_9ROSI|nr:B3 domain-containing transcription factor VRN1 [Morella rubra]KAB1205487.1 B3 domain-containing transcription factor VRN1 [Morella rubra]KAB1207419.1 B3 domain-containing transcription factor VRN1 [Morella rubra]
MTRRRTRVVPSSSHPRGSSSPMAHMRPPHFFKIILPSAMAEKKLDGIVRTSIHCNGLLLCLPNFVVFASDIATMDSLVLGSLTEYGEYLVKNMEGEWSEHSIIKSGYKISSNWVETKSSQPSNGLIEADHQVSPIKRIPAKFVREFGDELSASATLTLPNGQIWQVGLEEAHSKIWFQEGWRDFVEHHSIDHGYFLVFRYEGNSNFSVLVFDQTSTEIQYPWNNKSCQREDQVDLIELDDSKNSGHDDELIKKEMSNSDELSAEHEDREILVGKRRAGTSSKARMAMSRGSKRAIEAAKILKPKSPSFMAIMRHYQIHRCFMYVPAGFAINYLRKHQIVKLQTCDGQWHATCCSHKLSSSALQLRRGWGIFCKENNLEEGDVCVFELIKRKPIVLKVSIFRVVDYA